MDIVPFPNITVCCDAHHLPFKNSVFTQIIAICILEHLENPIQALREVKRVLNEEGVAKIVVPNLWEWRRILTGIRREIKKPDCDHKQGWDYLEINNLANQVGLRLVEMMWFDRYTRPKHKLDPILKRILPSALFCKEVQFTLI